MFHLSGEMRKRGVAATADGMWGGARGGEVSSFGKVMKK